VAIINTILFVFHLNVSGYRSCLQRRTERLIRTKKKNNLSLAFGMTCVIALYVWITGILQMGPHVSASRDLANSRFAMLMIHAGMLGLVMPGGIAMILTEFRACLFSSKSCD
jgi:hypothetical protein